MKKRFTTVQEIAEDFIKKGWSKNITFTEVTLEEAEAKGFCYNMISVIKSGRKYFKMNVSGDIYDDTGKLVYFDVPCAGQS